MTVVLVRKPWFFVGRHFRYCVNVDVELFEPSPELSREVLWTMMRDPGRTEL